jgi:DUF4097 and DUF4098 domain-containing protein YvlB
MKIMKLTTCLLLVTSLTALAATEEQLNKKFTVPPGGKLVVDVGFGAISVTTNAGSEVTIEVWRKVSHNTKANEEAFLRDHPVTFSQEGDTVAVRSRHTTHSGINWPWHFQNRDEGKYVITVPAQFSASLRTEGGGISVSDLTGKVGADTSGGRLDFARLHGSLDGDTSGGGIRATDCAGDIKLNTSGGEITADGGSGSLRADTSGGGITVKNFQGPIHLATSGGDLTIENVAGAVHGNTSGGAIRATFSELSEEVRLETSGGGITARIPSNAAFDLDAETSGGGASSELPVTVAGKAEHDHLKGTVNGGGKLVRLSTSGGNIHVEKTAPGKRAANKSDPSATSQHN